MMTSDFTPEMEMWPFRACAMKNMQYDPYFRPNRRNSRELSLLNGVTPIGGAKYRWGRVKSANFELAVAQTLQDRRIVCTKDE